MGFLSSIFKRQDPAPERSSDEALVARVRTSARRRLIGAVVLLGVGVVAFPLIFETQPRPIPVDIPIEIPRKDGQPPLALPASKPAAIAASKPAAGASRPAAVAVPAKAEAPREPTAVPAVAPPAAPVVALPAAASRPPAPKSSAPAAKADPKPEPKTEAAATSAKPASAPKPAEEGSGRFVVQVGAFAEATAIREARAKVEKLGLATYTQVVETANGKRTRVRVGPFATREEADTVAAKLKAAGLPGAVLTL